MNYNINANLIIQTVSFVTADTFFFLTELELSLSTLFASSLVVFTVCILFEWLFLRPIVSNNSPCFTSLNKEIAS